MRPLNEQELAEIDSEKNAYRSGFSNGFSVACVAAFVLVQTARYLLK